MLFFLLLAAYVLAATSLLYRFVRAQERRATYREAIARRLMVGTGRILIL